VGDDGGVGIIVAIMITDTIATTIRIMVAIMTMISL
jgi:hypothetical protein